MAGRRTPAPPLASLGRPAPGRRPGAGRPRGPWEGRVRGSPGSVRGLTPPATSGRPSGALRTPFQSVIQALRQRVGILDSMTLSSGLGLGLPSGSGPVAAEEEIPAVGRERQPPEPVVIPLRLQSLHPAGFAAPE